MENTSCGQNCPYVKIGFCKQDCECPNYIESWWQQGQSGEAKLVKDCVPKRTMLQLAAIQARLEGVQAASEESRNQCLALKSCFDSLLNLGRQQAIENQSKQSIEFSGDI